MITQQPPLPDFFARYPVFFQGTPEAASIRPAFRYRTIIAWNRHFFPGARVLDLGSHAGHWTFAALQAGAAHVTCVEANAANIAHASANFISLSVPQTQYTLRLAEIYPTLAEFPPGSFDVVLACGVLYHFEHHVWFFDQIKRLAPTCLIIDSTVWLARHPAVKFSIERPGDCGMVVRPTLRGVPSSRFLLLACRMAGYRPTLFPAATDPALRDPPNAISEYLRGTRVTIRAVPNARGHCQKAVA